MKDLYIIQERFVGIGHEEWYEDCNHPEFDSLEEAETELAADRRANPGHYEYYDHRIVKRTEEIVRDYNKSLND